MSTWVEEMGLHSEGFNDQQIAEIDGIKDDLLHLWATFRQELPRFKRVAPTVQMILEVVNANQKAGQI